MRRIAGYRVPVPTFRFEGRRIAYSEFGSGSQAVVLIHGLLLSQRMHEPLAAALAARGHRVVTIDLLGHGRSERPTEPWCYSVPIFAGQVVGLLDRLALDEAAILGTSLGANITLEVCRIAPERVRGMVIEMPVLDHALIASVIAFTPLALMLTFGGPVARLAAAAARAVPQGALPFWGDVLLDTARQEPKPSSAVMQGLFSGRIAPNSLQRRELKAPTLVIGHRRDPVHPLTDAGMIVDELPDARLVEAHSILERVVSPRRLTGEIGAFLDACWKTDQRQTRRARAVGATRPA
jgi:pimeloyl-ACP methyl ester carboxylesterase